MKTTIQNNRKQFEDVLNGKSAYHAIGNTYRPNHNRGSDKRQHICLAGNTLKVVRENVYDSNTHVYIEKDISSWPDLEKALTDL